MLDIFKNILNKKKKLTISDKDKLQHCLEQMRKHWKPLKKHITKKC